LISKICGYHSEFADKKRFLLVNQTLDYIRKRFDKESGLDFMDRFNHLSDEVVQLQQENIPPESDKCQQVVKEYWGGGYEVYKWRYEYASQIGRDWQHRFRNKRMEKETKNSE